MADCKARWLADQPHKGMMNTNSRTSSDDLRGAAFHEAGHVVVAQFFGLPVGEVEIRDDGAGKADIGLDDHLPLIDRIALCVAGIVSQELFNCRHTHELAAAHDYAKVIELVEGLTELESLQGRTAAYRRALEIVETHSTEVERLAHHLIEHRRIDGRTAL